MIHRYIIEATDEVNGFEEAIEQLDREWDIEELEPCDDAISRADAKKYLSAPDANGDRVIYESDLDLLPSVTPQPKTGRWIFVDKAKEHARCSECDYGNVDLFDGRPHNYCPDCGTKMEGMEE